MRQDDRVESLSFYSLPVLAGGLFDHLTVTELFPKHLYVGHLLSGFTVPLRDTSSLRSQKTRESGYPTKEGTS
jgi:hypothetical protein